jgi:2-dehydro-3-deoxygalactonokinase
MTASFVALDWGTTSFRAYLVAVDGTVLETRTGQGGILSVAGGAFEAAFERHLAGWNVALPHLASGMITSRQGWIEVPYVAAPAGLAELSGAVRRIKTSAGRMIAFVPGVAYRPEGAAPDVIRGEETQVLGASDAGDGMYVTRGTHCKWLEVKASRIERFATFMTGELFAVLKDHSILGRLMTADEAGGDGFERGVKAGLDERDGRGGLLHKMFSVRTLGLFDELAGAQLAPYLSGMLLGAEISGARAMFAPGTKPITVIGAPALTGPFSHALKLAGLNGQLASPDAAVRGLDRIGKQIGIIP